MLESPRRNIAPVSPRELGALAQDEDAQQIGQHQEDRESGYQKQRYFLCRGKSDVVEMGSDSPLCEPIGSRENLKQREYGSNAHNFDHCYKQHEAEQQKQVRLLRAAQQRVDLPEL